MGIFTNKIVGIFSDRTKIDSLLNDLNSMGFNKNDISVLAKDNNPERNKEYQKIYVVNPDSMGNISNLGARLNNHINDMIDSVKNRDLIEHNKYNNTHDVRDKDPTSMVKGATTGGAVGLLAGLSLLLIPGVGPILGTGAILSALTAGAVGAAVGTTTGTLIGLLKDEGIPNDRIELYTNHFNNGDVIVIVDYGEDRKSQLREIFIEYNANLIDIF